MTGCWVSPEIRDSIVSCIERLHEKTGIALGTLLKFAELPRSKFYEWKRRFGQANHHNGHVPRDFWLEDWEKEAIINYKGQHDDEGYRRLTYMMMDEDVVAVSPATTYRVLCGAGLMSRWNQTSFSVKKTGFVQPKSPHEHWHMDISYVKFQGVFQFLISVLDGCSRFVLHHDVRAQMQEYDVQLVLQEAFEKYPEASPRLITDNGSQFIAREFKVFIQQKELSHVKTSPNYPQSNGKIEAFHKNIKTECLRRKSFLSQQELRASVKNYIDFYNHKRLHSGIHYLPPAAVLDGSAESILKQRDRKLEQARKRRQQNYLAKKQKPLNEKSTDIEIPSGSSNVSALSVLGS